MLPEVDDSLVVHLDDPDTGHGKLILFVVARDLTQSEAELSQLVASTIRTTLSPRHVPDKTLMAPAIPRTLTGKKLEVPVKRILQGANPDQVVNPATLANPDSLDYYRTVLSRSSHYGKSVDRVNSPTPSKPVA